MDPLEGIDIDGDSSFVLMLEAQRRGYEVFHAAVRDLELDRGRPWVVARPAEVRRNPDDHHSLGPPARFSLEDDVRAVFMRKDPPVDVDYVVATYVLDRIARDRVVLVNDPQALRDCNEKLFTVQWAHLMPHTIVSSRPKHLSAFIDEVGDAVVKPLMTAGGAGVIRLRRGDQNTGAVLDLLTGTGKSSIMAQAYLPEVTDGDRRIILIGGQAVGVINRRPSTTDLRSNMHVGGTAEPATLTEQDLRVCAELGPELVRRGLPFVGIDVIGGKLTEINVTSPTGLQEIDRFDGVCLEGRLFDWIEARARSPH